MSKAIHPTTIKLRNNHCGHAVELWRKNTPIDRTIFHVGVAAHYVLEMIGKNPDESLMSIAWQCAEQLATNGRAYDGVPEPPMPADKALEGTRMAIKYAEKNEIPTGDNIFHEMAFAFNKDWNQVEYNCEESVFQTLLDVVEIHEEYDEESDSVYRNVIVRDYKSSWAADADELDSFQRRCQAVVAWLVLKPDILTMEIANVRFHRTYTREINCYHQEDELQQWFEDIKFNIKVLQQSTTPDPGVGCVGCQYVHVCEHADQAFQGEDLLKKYSVAKALTAKLAPQVRKLTKSEPLKCGAGYIGYKDKERMLVKEDAGTLLAEKWNEQGGDALSMLSQMELGLTTIKKLAKILCESPTERRELIEALTQSETYSSFGMHK